MLTLVQRGKLEMDADVNGLPDQLEAADTSSPSKTKVTLPRTAQSYRRVSIFGLPRHVSGRPHAPTLAQMLDGERRPTTACRSVRT